MAVQERLYTAQDLWTRSHQGGETQRLELVQGEIVEMAPTGGQHGLVTMELGRLIANYACEQGLGVVAGAETGFMLATQPDTVRAPDVAFITKDRLPRPVPVRFFPLAPDLAVEVVSPSDMAQDVRRKVIDFLQAGTRLVWVVYPDTQTVDVYQPGLDVRVIGEDGALVGAAVLPGFELPLRALFAVLAAWCCAGARQDAPRPPDTLRFPTNHLYIGAAITLISTGVAVGALLNTDRWITRCLSVRRAAHLAAAG